MTLTAPTTFRAGAITAVREAEIVEVKTPPLRAGEALVQIEATAICTWEQRSYSGAQENTFPFIGGHEIAGRVVAFGEGYTGTLSVGDRVALGSVVCASCHWCYTGQDQECSQHYSGSVSYDQGWGPGGFAEYKIHPANGLYPLGNVPARVGALAEPLSCALHAAKLSGVSVGDDVVVIGAGVMGLMNVIAMKRHGARVLVSEVDPGRLNKAKELGADVLIDATKVDPVQTVLDETEGRGASIVITAIGHPSANEQGLAMLAKRGTMVLFASAHPEVPIQVQPNLFHNHEKRLIGVLSSDQSDFALAARLLRYGQVNLEPLIQNDYPLSRLQDALEESILPGTYRIIVAA